VNKWTELTAPEYVWSDGKELRDYAAVRQLFGMGKLEEYKTMQAVRASPDVIVLSYRASIKSIYSNKPFQSDVAECRVWVGQRGKWRNTMLQENSNHCSISGWPYANGIRHKSRASTGYEAEIWQATPIQTKLRWP
jgi:hypothetical protein